MLLGGAVLEGRHVVSFEKKVCENNKELSIPGRSPGRWAGKSHSRATVTLQVGRKAACRG